MICKHGVKACELCVEEPPKSVREAILQTSISLTMGDRDDTYGDPAETYKRVAALMNAYKGHPFITAHDVAMLLALMKIGRTATDPNHTDNYVDGAAYMAIAGEIAERGE